MHLYLKTCLHTTCKGLFFPIHRTVNKDRKMAEGLYGVQCANGTHSVTSQVTWQRLGGQRWELNMCFKAWRRPRTTGPPRSYSAFSQQNDSAGCERSVHQTHTCSHTHIHCPGEPAEAAGSQ